MGNLLFSPKGRIGSSEFMRGALILIVITLLLGVPQMLGILKPLQSIFGILSLILLYPWVVLWIKRYHDAGKSGWMCFIPIIVYIIAFSVLIYFFMGDAFSSMMEAASQGASEAEMEAIAEEAVGNPLVFGLASAALSYAIAFVFNSMIKGEAGSNSYG